MAIIIRDGSRFNGALERTLPYIATALVQNDADRVPLDGRRRTGGTIRLRGSPGDRRQVVNILQSCKERFGDRVKRVREVQDSLGIPTADLPPAPRHPFYDRLNKTLDVREFDRFMEARCRNFYAAEMGRRSLPPAVYFRLLLIGYFEEMRSACKLHDDVSLPHTQLVRGSEQFRDSCIAKHGRIRFRILRRERGFRQ